MVKENEYVEFSSTFKKMQDKLGWDFTNVEEKHRKNEILISFEIRDGEAFGLIEEVDKFGNHHDFETVASDESDVLAGLSECLSYFEKKLF